MFSDIDGSLAGISDFSEDIVSNTGSDSGGISSLDGSKSDTGIYYNTEPSIEKSEVLVILYSKDSNYKAYNYYKVAGETYRINISAMSRNATLLNEYIVSLNELISLNLTKYNFLK